MCTSSLVEESTKISIKDRVAFSCRFSADGQYLGIGCLDGTVAVFDSAGSNLLKEMYYTGSWDKEQSNIISIQWSPCSKFLVTANISQFVLVWNVLSGKPLLGIKMPYQVTKVTFHPSNSTYFMICLERGAVKIAHREHKETIKTVPIYKSVNGEMKAVTSHKQNPSYFLTGEFHPSGKWMFVTTPEHNITVLDIETHVLVTVLKVNTSSHIDKMCTSLDGSCLALALKTCSLLVFDITPIAEHTKDLSVDSGDKMVPVVIEQSREDSEQWVCVVSSLCLSPDHKYLLLGYGRIAFCDLIIYDNHMSVQLGNSESTAKSKNIHSSSTCGVTFVDWHPTSSKAASVMGGCVYVHDMNKISLT